MVEPGEPLWLDDDTEDVLAFLEYERDLCSGCGQPLTDTLREDAVFDAKSVICAGCFAKDHKASQVQADTKHVGAVNEFGRRYYVVER